MASSNFICPTCGGTLVYNPGTNKLKCSYCDAITDFVQQDLSTKDLRCSTCNAALITDSKTIITCCPYCGNSTVSKSSIPQDFVPDLIIPFKLTKAVAEKKYTNFYSKRWLVPDDFRSTNHKLDLQGIYVPYWLFTERVNITGNYIAFDTDKEGGRNYYNINLSGNLSVTDLPIDASMKMNDEIMDAIEPYNLKELVGFSFNYLPGFIAEYYDVPSNDCVKRLHKRLKKSVDIKVRKAIKHGNISTVNNQYEFEGYSFRYALMPIWTIASEYDDKIYHFVVNGQTGEVLGDLPISKQRMAMAFAMIFIAAFLIAIFITKTFSYSVMLAFIAACGMCTLAYKRMKFNGGKDDNLSYLDTKLKLDTYDEKPISAEEVHKIIK